MSLNPKQLAEVKRRIEDYELRSCGLQKISGAEVVAKRINVSGKMVKANVKVRNGEGEPVVSYEDVVYPASLLDGICG